MHYKIAIIGPKDAIIGFSALGVTPFEAYTAEDALAVLRNMKKEIMEGKAECFAIVLMIEDLMKEFPKDEYAKLTREALPAVISVPGIHGATGFGEEKVRRMVEQAVGSDIFGGK